MSLVFVFVVAMVIWLWGKAIADIPNEQTTAQQAPTIERVNDIHSQLNATDVAGIRQPRSVADIQAAIFQSRLEKKAISLSGGRHAMGGQQFGTGTLLLDMREMNRVLHLDRKTGRVTVQAGIQWPALMDYLVKEQDGDAHPWGIAQKQTGADSLTLGGALSANIHSRGLKMKPFISDVVSFKLVNAEGRELSGSREENRDLFRLAIGGYGLFGVITEVELQLVPRQKVRRDVVVLNANQLVPAIERCKSQGAVYGDFQFSTDLQSEDFLNRGVMSCYTPVPLSTVISEKQRELTMAEWVSLYQQAHTDKKGAFDRYSRYYQSTHGQVYWSDLHQLTPYPDNYHVEIDRAMHTAPASEMITEIYVPRETLTIFLNQVRQDFRQNQVNLFYGTVRFIEPDAESFLAWAKKPYACIIFNLHTAHDAVSLAKTENDFRRLIDRAIALDGSYYLTYHRWATRDQVERCYPRFKEFLAQKKKFDPDERFQSDWYRHFKRMFVI